ncbi:MAG: ABC transporter permease [Proteobacteria bacterium]|nr:ABC transporter permease [Pseudomonadota bacterium]
MSDTHPQHTLPQTGALSAKYRNPIFVIAAVITCLTIFTAIAAPLLVPNDPYQANLSLRLAPPSLYYPMGNDALGRCLFSRIIIGVRTSIGLGVTVVVFSCMLGVVIGLLSGFTGGFVDEVLMRITDIFFSFPEILAAMAVAGLAGPGATNLLFAVSVVSWMRYARIVRGVTLSVKEREYVKYAHLSGVSTNSIIFRHILPVNMSSVIVLATIGLAKAILAVSSLGFLGFGVQPPEPELGTLLMEGKDYIMSAPHLCLYPGLAVMFPVLSFNILGDKLQDRFGGN